MLQIPRLPIVPLFVLAVLPACGEDDACEGCTPAADEADADADATPTPTPTPSR